MLDELLRAPSLEWTDTQRVRCALGSPACWPEDPALRALAGQTGVPAPGPPEPGETLLVAVSKDRLRATLIRLRRPPSLHRLALPVGPETQQTLDRVAKLAPLHASLLTVGTPPAERPWELMRLMSHGPGELSHVDGASFGLAMLLAALSAWLQEPLPADLVALAAIDDEGRVGAVEGLREKLLMVRRSALGVRRIIVAAEQHAEAAEIAAAQGGPRVIGVDDATAAVAVAFETLSERLRTQWSDRAQAIAAADRLLELTLSPSREVAIRWEAVASTAELLRGCLHDTPVACDKVEFAKSVALRHAGHAGHLAWPSQAMLDALPKTVRLRCLAHALQSASDSGHADLAARLDDTLATLNAKGDLDDISSLEVLSAIGRTFALMRQYVHARDTLRRAVAGWYAIHEARRSSHALCELLRVCGVLEDSAGLDEALGRARGFVEAYPRERVSIGYLRWSAGRALVHAGRPDEALGWLTAVDLSGVEAHVRAGVLRAMALAHAARREPADAAALRARLATCDEVTGARELAALDAALDGSDDALEACLDALEAFRLQGMHGLLGEGTPRERALRLSREYPY